MKLQFIVGYVLVALFILFSLISQNFEFIVYAAATVVLLGVVHFYDKKFSFNPWAVWGLNLWMVLHIAGGLLPVGDSVLYNLMFIDLVGEPYRILKYDQVVHAYAYFIAALLIWSVVKKASSKKASFGVMTFITVMAASGVGGLNEIIEFATTIFFDTNVGGYENTAIDIVANLVGALLAIPFFKKIK